MGVTVISFTRSFDGRCGGDRGLRIAEAVDEPGSETAGPA